MQNIKRGLQGSLEMTLLMPNLSRWFDSDRKAARLSFLIPTLLLPLSTLGTYRFNWNYPADAWSTFVTFWLIGAMFTVIKYAIFLCIVRTVAVLTKKFEHYYSFVVANNWLMFVKAVLLFPIWWMLYNGGDPTEVYNYIILTYIYLYVVLACMAVRVMNLSWEAACFVPIASWVANGTIFFLFHKWGGMIVI